MNATQIVGGAVVVGGVLWLVMNARKMHLPMLMEPPVRHNNYPIPAETNRFPNPPASQTADLPEAVGTCPNIVTIEDYNKLAKKYGMQRFRGELKTNAPDDPDQQTFNTLVTALKTKLGCFAPPDQDDTSTALPSNLADQSISYK